MRSILIILCSILILLISSYLAYNPSEMRMRERDQSVQEVSKEIIDAIDKFYKKYACFPWEHSESKCAKLTQKFDQIPVSTPSLVLDKLTEEPQGLSASILKESFLSSVYLTNVQQSVNLCFAPESKLYRAKANRTRDGQTFCRGSSCFVCISS